MKNQFSRLLLMLVLFSIAACSGGNKKEQSTATSNEERPIYTHVDWSKNANIYEVNIRQYTPEGTFNAFVEHMPRLKKMGVDILWLMPIHPIGEKKRKGSMGSYYAVKDYQKVNPEFGTMEDLQYLVKKAHDMDMHVIIDWVANHTAWDNWLIEEHPDWYTHDSTGAIVAPVADWSDVADLNYDVPEMREYMIQSLEYWVREANIDGYRCDVAGMVPNDFWVNARQRLDSIKPVFMLAEWGEPHIHEAFDMSYGWDFHHIMNEVAQGKQNANDVEAYFNKVDTTYNSNDYIMHFTSNHDENSWNGTVFERLGEAAQTMAVLSATVPGMPLIYSGQEDKLDKRLEFFEKDAIEWGNFEWAGFYSKLLHLKKNNTALWNGDFGGSFDRIHTNADEQVFVFSRVNNEDKIIAVFNLSDKTQNVNFSLNQELLGEYTTLFNDELTVLSADNEYNLQPWNYSVMVKVNK